jgi:hypothetical protein
MEHAYGGTTSVGTRIPLMIPGIGAIRKTPKMRCVFLLRKILIPIAIMDTIMAMSLSQII